MPRRVIWTGLAETSCNTIVGRIVELPDARLVVEQARHDAMGDASWTPCDLQESQPILMAAVTSLAARRPIQPRPKRSRRQEPTP